MLRRPCTGAHVIRRLIRNGTVVTAEAIRLADVLIVGETVAAVAPGLEAAADAGAVTLDPEPPS